MNWGVDLMIQSRQGKKKETAVAQSLGLINVNYKSSQQLNESEVGCCVRAVVPSWVTKKAFNWY